jgi:hypothetical protein
VSRGLGLALGVAIVLGLVIFGPPGTLDRGQRTTALPAHQPPVLTLAAPAGPAVTIAPDPIGLSIEYPLLAHDLGNGRCPPASLVRTIDALGLPTLRIGGDSQDTVAPAGTPPHPGVTDLPPGFFSQLACLERETRIPIVVGLNLASGEPAWAAELAASARAAVAPGRLSFELGNEPDIYGRTVLWWNGRALLRTPMPWATYLRRARAVEALLGTSSAIEGPDFASGRWVHSVPLLTATLHLRTLDAHFYPLDACRNRAAATAAATTASLLSRQIQTKISERVRVARYAHVERLPAVISETNSVSCGGLAGVSDEPAAAVWAVRMILRALRAGFAAVRFHASGRAYDPFVVTAGVVTTRPLYRGLVAAAQLLRAGAALRAIPNAGALDGVAITRSDGARTIVLSNYAAVPRWVLLAATTRVRVLRIVARAPVVQHAVMTPAHGRVRVELRPNSVEAITVPPS